MQTLNMIVKLRMEPRIGRVRIFPGATVVFCLVPLQDLIKEVSGRRFLFGFIERPVLAQPMTTTRGADFGILERL